MKPNWLLSQPPIERTIKSLNAIRNHFSVSQFAVIVRRLVREARQWWLTTRIFLLFGRASWAAPHRGPRAAPSSPSSSSGRPPPRRTTRTCSMVQPARSTRNKKQQAERRKAARRGSERAAEEIRTNNIHVLHTVLVLQCYRAYYPHLGFPGFAPHHAHIVLSTHAHQQKYQI